MKNTITEADLIGAIKDFPLHVVEAMLDEQEKQGNKRDVKVFQMLRTEGRACCGFDWNTTKDGSDYWRDVIASKKFYLLPNPAEQEANNEPATDLIGDIKDFPLHVVEAMLDEQEKQGK